MTRINVILSMLVFLCFLAPAPLTVAQDITTLSEQEVQANNGDVTDEDKKTDKKKKKDVIEINQSFFINLGINIATVLLLILLIYYPNYRRMDYIFTFILFNLVIFMLTYVLNEVKISLGAAFGLFAVFSMLRYRTAGISMKDMTYLFTFIALGLISAIQLEYYELAIICGIIFISVLVLDSNMLIRREFSKKIRYDNIELITSDNELVLIEDLKKRTGLNIHRISINRIDFLRDTANIRIYYYA